MKELVKNSAGVSILIEWDKKDQPQITKVTASGPGSIHEARFLTADAADKGLYPGLAVFLRDLANAARNIESQNPVLRRFYKRLDQLVLEDLRVSQSASGALEMSLVLTQGDAAAVFGSENTDIISDSFSDVFLPLTNLSAYLRALSDTKGSSAEYAMDQTADRIEEFLLAYGHRLKGGAQVVRLTA